MGGVNKAEDVVEVTMVGGTVVGMVAAPLLRGNQVFDQVEILLRVYLADREVADINDLRGLTHQRIAEAEQRHDARAVIDPDRCTLCHLCRKVCFKQAPFVAGDTMKIDAELCVGCGLCVSVCPDEAIALA